MNVLRHASGVRATRVLTVRLRTLVNWACVAVVAALFLAGMGSVMGSMQSRSCICLGRWQWACGMQQLGQTVLRSDLGKKRASRAARLDRPKWPRLP